MKLTKYSHNNGNESIPDYILDPLFSELQNLSFSNKRGTRTFRKSVSEILLSNGWSKPVRVSIDSQITITSVCKKIGLCFQFGNMARLYADILKLQLMHQRGNINAALYLVPMKDYAVRLGSNLANFERLTSELKIFGQIINVPLLVIGIQGDE
jgi:hypothetical protein